MDENVDKFIDDIQLAIWILVPATFMLVTLFYSLLLAIMSHLDVEYFNELIILEGLFVSIPFAITSIGSYTLFYNSKKPVKYNYLFKYITIIPMVLSLIEYSFAKNDLYGVIFILSLLFVMAYAYAKKRQGEFLCP